MVAVAVGCATGAVSSVVVSAASSFLAGVHAIHRVRNIVVILTLCNLIVLIDLLFIQNSSSLPIA
jgi:hypothetical protein